MPTRRLLLTLLAVAATSACTALPAHATGNLVDLQIVDRSRGDVLSTWRHRGTSWVAGRPGDRYALRLSNRTGGRVLVVLSVDGVNVVSGETASTGQTGYVLGPWASAEITGWRKSYSEAAAFYFTALPDSYAARTDRPDNVGVIGAAIFRERVVQPAQRPFESQPPVASGRRDGRPARSRSAAPRAPAPRPTPPSERSAAAPASPPPMRDRESLAKAEKLGTGHGEREYSPTTQTDLRARQLAAGRDRAGALRQLRQPAWPRASSAGRSRRRCRSPSPASCPIRAERRRLSIPASGLAGDGMDLELKGKRALVTGGSRGIGKAVARALAREGADVALLARDRERLAAAAAELSAAFGGRVVAVVADTGDDAQVERAVAEAAALLGGSIDILVNAAAEPGGYAAPPKLAELQAAALQREIDIKVMGYIRTARARSRRRCRRAAGAGSSTSAAWPTRQSGNTIGSIRNVAVAALTKNLADELGPSGINVTVVHPGLTRTERTAALVAAQAKAQGVSEEVILQRMAEGNSIRHLVDAAEVADVVAFLASPKSVAINGDAIAAGGGVPRAIHY